MLLGAALWGIWLKPGDVPEYQFYAEGAWRHPGEFWPREYPPLALALFVLPLVLPFAYAGAFALWASLQAAFLCWMGEQRTAGAGGRFVGYILLGAAGLVTSRYDIFPAACLALSVWAVEDRRYARAWTWAVVGALLKLFPVVMAPLLLLQEHRDTGRWRWDRAGYAGLLTAAGLILPTWLENGTIPALSYLGGRPPSIGSLAAGLLDLIDRHVRLRFGYGSLNVLGPHTPLVTGAVEMAAVGGMLVVCWAFWRGYLSVTAGAIALVTLLILGTKVFSVQYLIWLMPLWSQYPFSRWLALVALLNTLVYPFLFNAFIADPARYGPPLVLTALLRNTVLALGTFTLVYREGQQARGGARELPSPVAPPSAGMV